MVECFEDRTMLCTLTVLNNVLVGIGLIVFGLMPSLRRRPRSERRRELRERAESG